MNRAKAEKHVKGLLTELGIDITTDGVRDTPARFVKAMEEYLSGYLVNPLSLLDKAFDLEDEYGSYDSLVVSGPLPFCSLCEHHLALIEGHAWIGYLPGNSTRVVGLSKLARVLEAYARRLQIQERLTMQVARAIETAISPAAVMVLVKAKHSCQRHRGIRKDGEMQTVAMLGAARTNPTLKEEFMWAVSNSQSAA